MAYTPPTTVPRDMYGNVQAPFIDEVLRSIPEGQPFNMGGYWIKRGGELVKLEGSWNPLDFQTKYGTDPINLPFGYDSYVKTPGSVKWQGASETSPQYVKIFDPANSTDKIIPRSQGIPQGWVEFTPQVQAELENRPRILNGQVISAQQANEYAAQQRAMANPEVVPGSPSIPTPGWAASGLPAPIIQPSVPTGPTAGGRIVDTRPGSPTLGLLVPDYTAISPERMQNEKKITLPSLDLTSKDGVYNSIIAGATGNLFTPTSTETKQQSILDQMASLVSEGTQKGADQLAMEKAAGIETLNTQLSDISNQIKAKALEFEAFKQAQQGKPITMSSITGSIAEQQSKIASDVLLLQAQGEILQGKLTNAQNNINRAIDLKYSAIENRYKIYQAQLEALKPTLDREERQRAAILEQQKLVEQRKYEEAKQAEKDKKSLIMDYIEKYKDAGITLNDSLETAQAKLKNSKIYQQATRLAGGGGGGTGVTGKISSMTQAVIDNPSLFDDLTPTNKGKVVSELQQNNYDTSNLGLKGLSDTAIKEVSQTQKALDDLSVLKTTINNNLQYIGPISGWQKLNPWSKARQVQADIDRVKQTVGKALEGGVLRKEDEEKYKKILATITDTPETALYKLDSLITSLNKDIANYKSLQQSGGRSLNVGESLTKKGSVLSSGSTSGGNSYTITKE